MKELFLFPGQGAQCVGMGKDLYEHYTEVKDLFALCADVTGKDILNLLFNSEEEVLQRTDNTQIAMTLVNLSVARALQVQGIVPDMVAGFSLGEYAAMVVAGIIKPEEVFELVVIRGLIMDEESKVINQKFVDEGKVGMTAILGIAPDDIRENLEKWNIPNVYLSMYNSPIQGVLGGTENAREEAGIKLSELGARRVIPLKVSGPFHTPLMKNARDKFEVAIRHITFADPSIPIFSNVNGAQVHSGNEMKSLCLDQLIKPVQWIDEEQSVWDNKPDRIYEVGVGNVLSGLWKAWKKSQSDEHIPDCNITGTVDAIKKLEE